MLKFGFQPAMAFFTIFLYRFCLILQAHTGKKIIQWNKNDLFSAGVLDHAVFQEEELVTEIQSLVQIVQ